MPLEGTRWSQQRAAHAREFERWFRVGRSPSETVPTIAQSPVLTGNSPLPEWCAFVSFNTKIYGRVAPFPHWNRKVAFPWSVSPPSQRRCTALANRGRLRFTKPLSVTCPSSSERMTGDTQNSTVRGDRSSAMWPVDFSAAAICTSASPASVVPIVDTKCSSPFPASSAASASPHVSRDCLRPMKVLADPRVSPDGSS